jgi:hypothetical protein
MAALNLFNVEIAGRRYSGTWHIEGKEVVVASAYGSKRAAAGRGDPARVAEKMLKAIVAERYGD